MIVFVFIRTHSLASNHWRNCIHYINEKQSRKGKISTRSHVAKTKAFSKASGRQGKASLGESSAASTAKNTTLHPHPETTSPVETTYRSPTTKNFPLPPYPPPLPPPQNFEAKFIFPPLRRLLLLLLLPKFIILCPI